MLSCQVEALSYMLTVYAILFTQLLRIPGCKEIIYLVEIALWMNFLSSISQDSKEYTETIYLEIYLLVFFLSSNAYTSFLESDKGLYV